MVRLMNIGVQLAVAAAKVKVNNTELVGIFRDNGGGVIHFRPGADGRKRGVTIAYRRKNNRIEFATAVQHGNDVFTKKIGTKTAITHFNNGQTVFLPLPTGQSVKDLFWFMVS